MTPASNPSPVLCAGRIYCDMLFKGAPKLPSFGTETFASGLEICAGGGAFITAAAFQALGVRAGLIGVLPAAPFETIVMNDIDRWQIDRSRCQVGEAQAGPQVTVAVSNRTDRAFLSHKAGAALPALQSADFGHARHLHIGELRSLVEHPELIALARNAGLSISLDCGWDDELFNHPLDIEELIASVDIFLPNEPEFARLKTAGINFALNTLVVTKCGANGAHILHKDGNIFAPALPVDVVDTTGAGDAFNAGFVAAWLDNAPLMACLETGHECGAAAISAHGGTAGLTALTRPEIQSSLVI